MKKVREVSRLSGVSVRTLHYYDEIGLLHPSQVTEAGYRLYDEAAMERLRSILLFRELRFPLKEIQAMMEHPSFDPQAALDRQIELLEMEYDRLGKLIARAKKMRGEKEDMGFDSLDRKKIDQYRAEVKEKWGGTKEYGEFEKKEKAGRDFSAAADGLMAILAELGALRALRPEDEKVQEKVMKLQAFITENYYPCSDEILMSLGEMYVSDERFRKNIDRFGGEGTAEFASRAIRAYGQRKK